MRELVTLRMHSIRANLVFSVGLTYVADYLTASDGMARTMDEEKNWLNVLRTATIWQVDWAKSVDRSRSEGDPDGQAAPPVWLVI